MLAAADEMEADLEQETEKEQEQTEKEQEQTERKWSTKCWNQRRKNEPMERRTE